MLSEHLIIPPFLLQQFCQFDLEEESWNSLLSFCNLKQMEWFRHQEVVIPEGHFAYHDEICIHISIATAGVCSTRKAK